MTGATIGAQDSAELTIIDNEVAQPGLLQFSSAVYSGQENSATVTITVNRSGGSDGPVSVQCMTSDGTASSGFDYLSTVGTLTFADGEISVAFQVQLQDDSTEETNETFLVKLSSVTVAGLGAQDNAIVTITDDDASIASSGGGSGGGNFSINLLLLFIISRSMICIKRLWRP